MYTFQVRGLRFQVRAVRVLQKRPEGGRITRWNTSECSTVSNLQNADVTLSCCTQKLFKTNAQGPW